MFATPAIAFHTILSLIAIGTGACVILCMSKGSRPGYTTLAFLITMVATDVTGFFLPATRLLPSHITGIISLAVIAIALAANYAFHFAGAWRAIYAVTMGIAIYLNFFVLVTQLFLKVGVLHALAPNAPDNPEPPFLIAQAVVLAIFVWLIWKSVKNFRPV
jgi:predicted neutral ceramidase superfamily lipid hydrolase